jgi:DNA primase
MSTTQEIKDRLDIVHYIQQYVPDLKKAGRYYKACCPFHGEKTPSFVVNPDTQSWRCFGACAEGGDIFNFAMKYHNVSFKDALRDLGDKAGVQVETLTPQQAAKNARLERLRGMLTTAADYYHQHLMSNEDDAVRQAFTYATEKRGFTVETLMQWQVGYAPAGWRNMLDALRELGYDDDDIVEAGLAIRNTEKDSIYDRFRNRLVIPIHDTRGRVVGFGARALDPDDQPKYLNSPQSDVFDKSRTLFGWHRARSSKHDEGRVVIVEGYMDVIQAHQAGFTNVVAQMGTALTETQLQLLVGKVNTIIMALDSDEAGQNATRRSLEVARAALEADYTGKMSIDMRVLQIEGAKDPDDILRETPHVWEEAMNKAQPVADFVIDMETANITSETPVAQRQAIARDILPILLASENDTYRHENLQKLSMRLRITEQDLMTWAQEARQKQAQQKKYRQARQQNPPPKTSPDAMPDDGFVPMDAMDGVVTSSSEEPPAFLPDDAMLSAPVILDDDIDDSAHEPMLPAPPKASLTMRNNSRAAERYCLRKLLQSYELLYTANRRLRMLGQDAPANVQGAFQELSSDDFSQADYRIIFATLYESLRQHDKDPLVYLEDELDASLYAEVYRLLDENKDDVALMLGERHQADYQVVRKAQINQMMGKGAEEDWVYRVLAMRRFRLQRERDELFFLIRDAEVTQDADAEARYHSQYSQVVQAWHRLNEALGQQHLGHTLGKSPY